MELPYRKPTRIPEFDYSSPNYYFVTICTYEKECLFYSNGEMNNIGKVAEECLKQIPLHFPSVKIDKYMIMPNHVHGILVTEPNNTIPLTTIVGQYKASVSKQVHSILPDLKVWQRSFHDHIIRNQSSYERIWQYIDTNWLKWKEDCFYVDAECISGWL